MVIAPGATPHHIDLLRSGIDLAPTIMELLGVPGDPGFEGTSLVGEVYGGWSAIRDVLVDLPMTSNSGRRRALLHATQNGTQKLICFDTDGDCRLFDLARDPMEKSAIVRGEAFADMKARYDAATRNIKEVAPYSCGADCLNGAYMRKQQQQQDGAQ
jgi:arylsulfatase A-like enzyme